MEFLNKKNKFIFFIFFSLILIVSSFVFGKNFDFIFNSNNLINAKIEESVLDNNQEKEKVVFVDEESAVIDTVQKSMESVVSIIVTKNIPIYKNTIVNPFGDLFGDDFGINRRVPTGETKKQEIGGGTGFVVSEDGLIVTNKHVVSDESADYSIVLNGGKTYELDVLARDVSNDVAVAKVKNLKDKLKPLPLADSSNIKLGQTVIAIGNALAEFKNTVTKGVVSGIERKITAGSQMRGDFEVLEDIIQTDAAINPGNSGGPLLNLSGEVIGINTAVSSEGQNIGFAIPINSVKYAIESVKNTGRIVRPYIGIRYIKLNESLSKENNLPYNYGIIVLRGRNSSDIAVIKNSPADKAGLKENDIILEINDKKIDNDFDFAKEVSKFKVGDKIILKVYRNQKIIDINVILEERQE